VKPAAILGSTISVLPLLFSEVHAKWVNLVHLLLDGFYPLKSAAAFSGSILYLCFKSFLCICLNGYCNRAFGTSQVNEA